MKHVRKANKVLTIADEQLAAYLKEGYDEIDEKGKVKTASSNKTYTAAEVKKLTAEYEAQIEKLKKKLDKKGGEGETTTAP